MIIHSATFITLIFTENSEQTNASLVLHRHVHHRSSHDALRATLPTELKERQQDTLARTSGTPNHKTYTTVYRTV